MSVIATTNQLITRLSLGAQGHNTVNYINKALWVHNGNQYITFVNNSGNVGMGKRAFPNGAWTVVDTGFSVNNAGDSHFTTSLGIDSDGFIHISYGMHDQTLIYAKSDAAEDITAFTAASMTGLHENSVTYPKFFKANDILYFSYRNGNATVGDENLNKYDVGAGTWSVVAHDFINGEADTAYCDNYAVGDDGSIHVSFAFRTSNSPITLSNYGYAYSTDGGTTWKKVDGSAQTIPITQGNAGLFEVGDVDGLINQNHIDVDSANHPHIAYWKQGSNGRLNYYHTWHNGTSWIKTELTSFPYTPTGVVTFIERGFARPGILVDRTTDKVYYFTRRFQDSYMEVYESVAPYTSWSRSTLGTIRAGWMEFGGIDYDQWHANHTLYLMFTNSFTKNPGELYLLSSNMSKVGRVAAF